MSEPGAVATGSIRSTVIQKQIPDSYHFEYSATNPVATLPVLISSGKDPIAQRHLRE